MPSDDDEKPDEQPEQTPKQRLLAWIRKKQPKITATNFTTDWNDGRAIGALVNAFAPGNTNFCRAMLCISAAYAVARCLSMSVAAIVLSPFWPTVRSRPMP